ncbi:beta-lactamase-like protein [Suillus paluster]|uniref:beta-lactamase-like protein n=1 Tax=Suillus paluster TaxID=48578 RepID=UPI001B8854E1|nr:beta-lactamase-like protein [Suillus paluster]KAG1733606.1 beta-lactamase-like protein [Suillus paluster]
MSKLEITVLYFAAASTATGLTEQYIALPAPQYPLSSLSGLLVSLHPDVGLDKILQSSQWSINAEMVDNIEESPEISQKSRGACRMSSSLGSVLVFLTGVLFVFFYLVTHRRPQRSRLTLTVDMEKGANSENKQLPAFTARRLTQTTFLIVEWDDIFNEHPFIYAKVVPSADTILIMDTGCGGATHNPEIGLKSLRKFIETVDIPDNDGKPLNEGGKMKYIVVESHCHYDHILGVEPFAADSPILGSSHSPGFVSPENFPANSECKSHGIQPPTYELTLVPHLHEITSSAGSSLGLTVLHTPGHTPDELALWDADEKMLYVGDTLYEDDPIIFPSGGSLPVWFSTMDQLIELVETHPDSENVMINCGHATSLRPALEVLRTCKTFMENVVSGKEPLKRRYLRRGTWSVEFREDKGRFSLICPERLVLEARGEVVV